MTRPAPGGDTDLYALTGRELDTVIAALRLWWLALAQDTVPAELLAVAANGAVPLAAAEIDDLSERLLFAGFAESARRLDGDG